MSKSTNSAYNWERQVIHGQYYPHIDGIRTLAILPVLLYHLCSTCCPGGFAGVDVFFVISGYLITGGILRELRKEQFTIGNFYLKRIRRVFPAYFVMIVIVLITGACLYYAGPMRYLGGASLMSALFSANIFFGMSSGGYFSPISEENPLENLWSLSVEEQFYIFIPLLLILIAKWKKELLQPILWIIALLSFVGATYMVYSGKTINAFYYLPWRAWELLAGSLLAFYPVIEPKRTRHFILAITGFILVLIPYVFFSKNSLFPGMAALPSVLGTILLIRYGKSAWSGLILSSRPFVFIGKISYSLYLYHWPVFVFWKYCRYSEFLKNSPLNTMDYASMVVVSFLLAYVSWKMIEVPFRLLNWNKRKAFIFALSGISAICMFGATVIITNGLKNYIHKTANISTTPGTHYRTFFEPIAKSLLNIFAKPTSKTDLGMRLIGDSSQNPSFILYGNSHALALGAEFGKFASERNITGYLHYELVSEFCNYDAPGRAEQIDPFLKILSDKKEIKTIVLSVFWNNPIDSDLTPDQLLEFCKLFTSIGKKVYILTNCPNWKSDTWNYTHGPSDLYAKSRIIPLPDQNQTPWLMKRDSYDARYAATLQKLMYVQNKGLATVIPMHLAFLEEDHYISIDPETKKPFYIDDNHLYGEGSARAVKYVFPIIFPEGSAKGHHE